MKIAYSGLKKFIQTEKSPEELGLILTNIGLEVESLDKVQSIPGGLEGLVIGEVIACEQHPNADRLRITQVNIGASDNLQIVCGAPNVAMGQKVVVATVGTTVYPNTGEPFQINKSKIRGEVSEGMICAEDEIGLGGSHAGIMVLPEDTPIGIPAKSYFNLEDDFVFEIGLTPNRADAASHLGVARDIAAYLRIPLQMPDLSTFQASSQESPIKVQVIDSEACPRYSGIYITGVEVKASPDWLKNHLNSIGLRPINNIVDITNYVLHELGQPLHAFDADKIKGQQVLVKKLATGTPFTTLDEVERKLDADDLMICDSQGPMCLAGVFGGKDSGVSETTQNIFLESAYFNAVSVRKTAKRHGLKTDSSFRFERGTDPDMTLIALKRAALLIEELAGGKVSSSIIDEYPTPLTPYEVEVSYNGIQKLIGKAIPAEEIKDIILALGMQVLSETQTGLSLAVPRYKVDVTRECDVTEEVLRIYGYDNVEIPTKVNASLAYAEKPNKEQIQQTIADLLSANGFLEIWCNSLTKGAYAKNEAEAVHLLNPLSSDLNVMRQSLLHPAMEVVAYNQNRKQVDLKFFEFGKTYHLIDGKYVERPRLAILLTGLRLSEQWNQAAQPTNFYQLKAAVDAVLNRLGLNNFQMSESDTADLAYGLKYFRGDKTLVQFGAVSAADRKQTEVDKDVWFADFDWQYLMEAIRKNKIINKEVSKFPAVRRDLSMLIDKAVSFETLKGIAFKTDKKLVKEVQVFDVYEGNKLPEGKKSYALAFILQDEEKTLTDKQIDAIMQKIMHNLAQSAQAEIRTA
ncbi:MAG: phenylalanine--tRNA ligase subunit beta [Pedobacter sp.]|nr:MAG: phenylalanine--tRNA ligase subunit beta [Pedobacter sp.]